MPKPIARAKKATRTPINEDQTFRLADSLIDEVDPLGRETKEGKRFEKKRPP